MILNILKIKCKIYCFINILKSNKKDNKFLKYGKKEKWLHCVYSKYFK
jgi:hypothetical protein